MSKNYKYTIIINKLNYLGLVLVVMFCSAFISTFCLADTSVRFTDVSPNPSTGITYERFPSLADELLNQFKQYPLKIGPNEIDSINNLAKLPIETRGWPGVAVFDFDMDGDMDLYVTNGPGVNNSLFVNQISQSGVLSFVDLAAQLGVGASEQDSSGTCYGDIDNDGDSDLMVLGMGDSNKLFENNGNGTFKDITLSAGISGGYLNSSGCSMGDINGDGYLDIVVANSLPINNAIAWWIEPFTQNQHNQLYLNQHNQVFSDISVDSGIQELKGQDPSYPGAAGVTWAISMVDYDLDGDVDIISADDNGFFLPANLGGIDRGTLHVFNNDGTGKFTDVSIDVGVNKVGAWMGLSFADFNSDGQLDMFVTNAGDYASAGFRLSIGVPYEVGEAASRWFLGQKDGSFSDPGIGALVAIPFAWGTVAQDYNNDGDTDILLYGGMDIILSTTASNPGVVLQNDGNANFTYNKNALDTDHTVRSIHGLASGDLNNDGFVDFISVSGFDHPKPIIVTPIGINFGGPFDNFANLIPTFVQGDTIDELVWSGITYPNGSLSIEINSTNDNGWVQVELKGGVNLIKDGRVNRDGIGAIVKFTPDKGKTVMLPVLGGASHLSQDSLILTFGLGSKAEYGVVDVLWPGGVNNRLYAVKHGEYVVFPEIPCDYKSNWHKFRKYKECVIKALKELHVSEMISKKESSRLIKSALYAYNEYHKVIYVDD
jgi:enediyne biosynthesis protein E4